MKLLVNRSRKAALLAKQGSTYIHLVVLKAHGLEAIKITEEELVDEWSEVLNVSGEEALQRFKEIAAKTGASSGASKLLGLTLH